MDDIVNEENLNEDTLDQYDNKASMINVKFTRSDWNSIEKMDTTDLDRMVIRCLSLLGEGKNENISDNLVVLGEKYYCMIRGRFKNYLIDYEEIVITEVTFKKKKDNIRHENTINRLNKLANDLLVSFSNEMSSNYGFTTNYIEIKGVTLIYFAYIACKKLDKKDIYEIYVGMQKFINMMEGKEVVSFLNRIIKDKVSDTLISDMKKWIDRLKEVEIITGLNIYKYAPHLIIYSKFDQNSIKPYKSQIELMDKISENIEYGFLIMYNAMIGLGKTTMASVSIPIYVNKMRENVKYSKLQVIMCCNIPSVRLQVAHMAYVAGIKFGIGSINSSGGVSIINHYICKKDEERVLIICGPEIAVELLKMDYNRTKIDKTCSNYILFLDEPNVGADIKNSRSLKDNMNLLKYLPDKAILSSATMVDVREMPDFMKQYRKIWRNTNVIKIYSSEIQIGCDVITDDGEKLVPHEGCKTSEDLNNCIVKVQDNPFLGRLYTIDNAVILWSNMMKEKIDIPNIDLLFLDVNNLSAMKVRSLSLDMLDTLSKTDIINKICNLIERDENISYRRLGTTDAYKMYGMTLVASDNPIDFCRENFADLLRSFEDKLHSNDFKNIHCLLRKFEEREQAKKKEIKNITDNIKNKDRVKNMIHEVLEDRECIISLLDEFQINTSAHVSKYAMGRKIEIRNNYPIEMIPSMNVPEWILELLICGVGIYTTSKLLDDIYIKHVLELASKGQLSYLVADMTIAYGTNYPFNKVIVTDDFARQHSLNTIFQLMGRTGRVGQSWTSKVYIEKKTKERIINFIHGREENNIELKNMNSTFIDEKEDIPQWLDMIDDE